MVKITLPGSIRSKKNSKRPCEVGGKFKKKRLILLPSKAYMAWENQARLSAAMQLIGMPITDSPIHVCAMIYYKGQQPDLSGCLESVGDCLEGLVWVDDKQIMSWDGSRLYHDLHNPRTEITVEIIQ